MSVYCKHGGQRGYKGHVLNMPQDVQDFLDKLPPHVNQLPLLVLRRHGSNNTYADFRVCRQKILEALQWLQRNNPFYKDITIDNAALLNLPEDSVPPQLLTIDVETEETTECNEDPQVCDSHSFLPLPAKEPTEDNAIRSIVNGTDPMEWPDIADRTNQ